MHWRYFTSSDNPSVWVVTRDSDGAIETLWESEDPISGGRAPIGVPEDESGTPLTGYTVLNVGLPTFSVTERLYTVVLTETQRETTLSTWGAYLVERGWLDTLPTTLVDPVTMVSARYQPSAIQWLMRFMAQATGDSTTGFYMSELVVSGGAWARPTP